MIVDGDAKTYLARTKEHERKVVEREAQLTKINKIVSSLEREETAICEQMLVP